MGEDVDAAVMGRRTQCLVLARALPSAARIGHDVGGGVGSRPRPGTPGVAGAGPEKYLSDDPDTPEVQDATITPVSENPNC